MSMLNMLLGSVGQVGTLTLFAQVFNASGTFTMPSGVVNSEVIVACTGGGGGNVIYGDGSGSRGAGGGSGRTVGTFSLSQGATVTVTVGAGGNQPISGTASAGGTSSFSTLSCAGGNGGNASFVNGTGVSGGGSGAINKGGNASCPAVLTLQSGAVDNTGGLYLDKNTTGGSRTGYRCGGAGCYGSSGVNTGAGGGDQATIEGTSGSGKVIVFYYKYV